MAQIDYNFYKKNSSNNQQTYSEGFKVKFFRALEDGETVFVRFPYDKVSDIHTETVHTVKVGGGFRLLSCLGDGCPLCTKDKAKAHLFVKVLVYETNKDQTVTPQAYVWSRPYLFGNNIEDALDKAFKYNLVPQDSKLSDVVFEIKRMGKGTGTRYDVSPAAAMFQTAPMYVKDFQDFDGVKMSFFYMTKTKEEIETYMSTGKFPVREKTKKEESIHQPSQSQLEVNQTISSTKTSQEGTPVLTQPVTSTPVVVPEQPSVVEKTEEPSKEVEEPVKRTKRRSYSLN